MKYVFFKPGFIVFLFCLLVSLPTYAAGGIALGATRVIYPAEAKQTSLAITNSHKQERYLINAWIENEQGTKEKSFAVTPPLFVSEPDSENTLRIIYAGPALAKDRESLFYLNVKAIPSVDKASIEGKTSCNWRCCLASRSLSGRAISPCSPMRRCHICALNGWVTNSKSVMPHPITSRWSIYASANREWRI